MADTLLDDLRTMHGPEIRTVVASAIERLCRAAERELDGRGLNCASAANHILECLASAHESWGGTVAETEHQRREVASWAALLGGA